MRHDVEPVHSGVELHDLKERLGLEFMFLSASLGGEIVSAAMLLNLGTAWHTQYLASTDAGRQVQALDLVVEHATRLVAEGGLPLSFGISSDPTGKRLDRGLAAFKEGFGARRYTIDQYDWEM